MLIKGKAGKNWYPESLVPKDMILTFHASKYLSGKAKRIKKKHKFFTPSQTSSQDSNAQVNSK
jgi:hypothetical protein